MITLQERQWDVLLEQEKSELMQSLAKKEQKIKDALADYTVTYRQLLEYLLMREKL